jgi:hypothetical protein
MQAAGQSRRRALWAGAALVLILAVLGVAVTSAGSPGRTDGRLPGEAVTAITLPYEEPPHIPPGPNLAQFTAYCRLCHSPRLVLTQPRLPEKQWGAVVHKMVAVYGAPIPPDQEPALVAYLMAIRGPDPAPPLTLSTRTR